MTLHATLKTKPLRLKSDFATLNSTEGLAALVIQEVFDATDCVFVFFLQATETVECVAGTDQGRSPDHMPKSFQ